MLANELSRGKGFKGCISYNLYGNENTDFDDAVKYNMLGWDGVSTDKCGWHESRNLPANDPFLAAKSMSATASLNSRIDKPVYHFSVDWRKDEKVSRTQMLDSADHIIRKMGLSDHQLMIFNHQDADHPHIHIVANRVHPKTGKAWNDSYSKKRLEVAVHDVAKEKGFLEVPGKHNKLLEKNRNQDIGDKKQGASLGERRRAAREWDVPLGKFSDNETKNIGKALKDDFTESKSWQDLQSRLANKGYEIRSKGQGAIVTDGKSFAKLSEMGKKIRLKALEEKYHESIADYSTKNGSLLVSKKVSSVKITDKEKLQIVAHKLKVKNDQQKKLYRVSSQLRSLNNTMEKQSFEKDRIQKNLKEKERVQLEKKNKYKDGLHKTYKNPDTVEKKLEDWINGKSNIKMGKVKAAYLKLRFAGKELEVKKQEESLRKLGHLNGKKIGLYKNRERRLAESSIQSVVKNYKEFWNGKEEIKELCIEKELYDSRYNKMCLQIEKLKEDYKIAVYKEHIARNDLTNSINAIKDISREVIKGSSYIPEESKDPIINEQKKILDKDKEM